jgi:hypothetical protein
MPGDLGEPLFFHRETEWTVFNQEVHGGIFSTGSWISRTFRCRELGVSQAAGKGAKRCRK